MRLHGNAALSWKGRRRLAMRVVEEGWTFSAAAEAAGVSVRCAQEVGRSLSGTRARPGLFDRSSAPRRVANRTSEDRRRGDLELRRLRFTAAEIAEMLGMALSTVSGILTRLGLRPAGPARARAGRRYERSRPGELVHVDVKRLGRIKGGAGWRVRGGPQHYNRTFTDRDGKRRNTVGWEYVHIAIDDYSRLAYAKCCPTRQRPPPAASCAARSLLRRHGISVERRADRQRLPPTARACTPSPAAARDPAPPHPPLPAPDQRQSRALHPHPARRLGLRRHLPLKQRTHRRP